MTRLSNGKKAIIFILIAVVVFGGVFLGITLTKDLGKSKEEITTEKAEQKLSDLLAGVRVEQVEAKKAAISDEDILSEEAELPDIKNYPLSVTGSGQINVEIFSSPEKAGTGTDGWLNDVAENFNRENRFRIDPFRIFRTGAGLYQVRQVCAGSHFPFQ